MNSSITAPPPPPRKNTSKLKKKGINKRAYIYQGCIFRQSTYIHIVDKQSHVI